MHQALYRKWRPTTFADVVGQDHITTTLKNELTSNHLAHAYLFTGSRGTGKTTLAKIFAKAVNCVSPVNGSPCGECEACKNLQNPAYKSIFNPKLKFFCYTNKKDKPSFRLALFVFVRVLAY